MGVFPAFFGPGDGRARPSLCVPDMASMLEVDPARRKAGDFPFYRFHLALRSRCWANASGFLTFTHAWQRPEL